MIKQDPITLLKIELLEQLSYYNVSDDINFTINRVFKDVRQELGNKTYYIQKSQQANEDIFNLWIKFYKIRVNEGLITKKEAYKYISDELISLTGIEYSPQRVEYVIKRLSKSTKKSQQYTNLTK